MKISDQEIRDIRDLIKDGAAMRNLLTNETVDAICEAALNARAELTNARRARLDLFAAHAMGGLLAANVPPSNSDNPHEVLAIAARKCAEAMLAEFDKQEAERAKDGSP